MKKGLGLLVLALFSLLLVACGETEVREIHTYTRDTTSGTRDAFFTGIDFTDAIQDDAVLPNVSIVETNGDMINKVKQDELGVGYISLSSLKDSGVKGLLFGGVEATEANVLNGTYHLKRPFNYIIREAQATDEEKIAAAFVAYMGTTEGKAVIKSKGGIVETYVTDKSWDDIKANYPVTAKDNSTLTVKFGGSTSVESIAKALSAAFGEVAGKFKAEHGHTGSGDAFKRTQGSEKDGASAIHVGFASRSFKSEELVGSEGTTGQLSWDAVVAVVNSKNTLTGVSAKNLKEIYNKTIKEWSKVTALKPINIYSRDTTSGTRDAFFTAIDFSEAIKDDALIPGVALVETNGDMINKVKNDKNAIGYISLSSLEGSGVKGLQFAGVDATEANVLSGDYLLKRPFNYIIRDSQTIDEEKLAAAFVAYMTTVEGKAIIKSKGGIVKITGNEKSWDDIKADYPVTAKDNAGLTVKFGGSTAVESIAKALSAAFSEIAGKFKIEHGHTGSGDAFKRTQGSEKDSANAIHVGFASRAFKTDELTGSAGTTGQLSWDAVVVVVHTDNTLANITAEALKKIYLGETRIW